MIWFVDLSLHPAVPIKRRAVLSSVRDVSALGTDAPQRNHNQIVPDATEHRRWVRAANAGEAIFKAQEEVLWERAG
jgi:hypothetical protein